MEGVTSLATSPDLNQQLHRVKESWTQARDAGDQAAMDRWHQTANQLREMGADETAANRLFYGDEIAGDYATERYSHTYGAAPQPQAPGTGGTGAPAPSGQAADAGGQATGAGGQAADAGGQEYSPFQDSLLGYLSHYGDRSPEERAFFTQLSGLVSNLNERAQQPFEYDPQEDPAFQSHVDQVTRQAGHAAREALEKINELGILPSSVAGDRVGQIKQEYQKSAYDTLPQYMDQAYGRQQDQFRNVADVTGVLGDFLARRDDERRYNIDATMRLENQRGREMTPMQSGTKLFEQPGGDWLPGTYSDLAGTLRNVAGDAGVIPSFEVLGDGVWGDYSGVLSQWAGTPTFDAIREARISANAAADRALAERRMNLDATEHNTTVNATLWRQSLDRSKARGYFDAVDHAIVFGPETPFDPQNPVPYQNYAQTASGLIAQDTRHVASVAQRMKQDGISLEEALQEFAINQVDTYQHLRADDIGSVVVGVYQGWSGEGAEDDIGDVLDE